MFEMNAKRAQKPIEESLRPDGRQNILCSPVVLHNSVSRKERYFNYKKYFNMIKNTCQGRFHSFVGFSVFDTKTVRTCLLFGDFLYNLLFGFAVNATVNTVLRIYQLELMLQFLLGGGNTARIVAGKAYIGSINLLGHLHTLLCFIQ